MEGKVALEKWHLFYEEVQGMEVSVGEKTAQCALEKLERGLKILL